MRSSLRTLTPVLAVLACLALVPAGASAAAREQLPTGRELGGAWKSRSSSQYPNDRIQGVSTGGLRNAWSRTYTRRTRRYGPERLVVVLYHYGDPALATSSFAALRSSLTASQVGGVPPFGEGSYGSTFGTGVTAAFYQGGTVGTVYLRRTGRKASKTRVGQLGAKVAAKVAATP